ncbi:MAG: methylmalonyl-CoA mutase family protein [Saprospiraceae bacterium]
MFEQFSPTTKTNWKSQIEKDLKGKPYHDLIWKLNEDLSLEPFYTREEIGFAEPLAQRSDNNWHIAEKIEINDCKVANKVALECLLGGADALELSISRKLADHEIEQLFLDIEVPLIDVHFNFHSSEIDEIQSFAITFQQILQTRGNDVKKVNGSISFPLQDSSTQWLKIKDLLIWVNIHLPRFQILNVNASNAAVVQDQLLHSIQQGVLIIDKLSELGVTLPDIHKNIRFHLAIGKRFFEQIAAIRALKLVWLHVQKAYEILHLEIPPISATFSEKDYDENQNTNMIRATTIALSAALGGVDCLVVMPADLLGETAFQRRIARNVQHLLKMESYIDRVADPAAGAYYIEQLTHEFARQVWEKFRQI